MGMLVTTTWAPDEVVGTDDLANELFELVSLRPKVTLVTWAPTSLPVTSEVRPTPMATPP